MTQDQKNPKSLTDIATSPDIILSGIAGGVMGVGLSGIGTTLGNLNAKRINARDSKLAGLVDANIKHTSIDIDSTEGESFVDKYGIRSVPTLLIIDTESNEVVKKHIGLLNIEGLKDFVLSYIS